VKSERLAVGRGSVRAVIGVAILMGAASIGFFGLILGLFP